MSDPTPNPVISQAEFAARRKRLMSTMGAESVALVAAAPHRTRNRDSEYPYRQDSDFFYLTGFDEPDAVAVFVPGRADGEFVLFCRPCDPDKEVWSGRRVGPERAPERLGADQAYAIEKIDTLLPTLLDGKRQLHYRFGADDALDSRVKQWLRVLEMRARAGARPPTEIVLLDTLLHELRLYKSPGELDVMRRSAAIAAAAHVRAMRATKPGVWEYQIEAEILHEFRRNGAVNSYTTIAGGGSNACILHYVENNEQLRDGELILIDAGAELQFYASDITRTFPVNGRFSGEQRALYEIVLAAQLAAINASVAGNTFIQPHEAAVKVLTQGLVDVGILRGELTELIEIEAYKPFYMHRTGHWLGMDVHDVGAYKPQGDWRILEPGMVTTVEPGLYIRAESAGVDPRWWNIGIRIEDDVVITSGAPEIMSAAAPKTVQDIESLMRGN